MKLFVDAADSREVRDAVAGGLVGGAIARGAPDLVRQIAGLVAGPVCAAVVPGSATDILRQARELVAAAPDVVVALPDSAEGLEAVHACAASGIRTAVTGCRGPTEALRAAQAGARYVAVVPGRPEGAGADGMDAVRKAVAALRSYGFSTEVLVLSVTSPGEVVDAALAGAHVAVVAPALLRALAPRAPGEAGRAEPAAAPRVGP